MKITKIIVAFLFGILAVQISAQGIWWNFGSASSTCYSRIQVLSEPADAGYVFCSDQQASDEKCKTSTYIGNVSTKNTDKCPWPWFLYTKPVNDKKYKFVHWECTFSEGDYTFAYIVPGRPRSGTAHTVGTTTTTRNGFKALAPWSKTSGVITAKWVAHYELIENHDVTVKSVDASLGSVAVTGPDGTAENMVGDEVSITARTAGHKVKFLGWKLNGEWVRDAQGKIVLEIPYTFIVTEANKGEYVAQFEGGHDFVRIKNRKTGHIISANSYFSGDSDEGVTGLIRAFNTFTIRSSLADALDDLGTIVYWYSYPRPKHSNETVHCVEMRGISTEGFYKIDDGVYLHLLHNEDNTYDIGGPDLHVVEVNDGNIQGSMTATPNMNYLWDFEGMDLDLTTKENYYTPDALIQGENGLWYSTHRASWNTMYETEQITAYVVTAVKEDGSLELVEVTGGIIPKGMPVLLECKTNDPTLNVMIPTMQAATFTASTNLLTTCDNYFPSQSVSASENYKGLTLINGRIGFGGTALTAVDGNHAYLKLPNEVLINDEYTSVTLAELVKTGVVGEKYNVTDLTAVQWVDGNQMLIAKDNNGYATPDAMPKGETWVDYMSQSKASIENDLNGREGITATVPETYDQSNWIALHLAQGKSATTAQLDYAGKRLTGVKGTLLNVTNPELLLEAELGTSTETPANVVPNVYVAASFNGDNHQLGTQAPFIGKEYFFVQPKPMELATIGWAQWDAANKQFVVPENVAHPEWNTAGLSGEFGLNGSLMEQGFDMSKLLDGHSYLMPALIKRNAEDYESIYILGNVDGNQFVPNKGVAMYTMDGKTYTATATITKATDSDPNGYIGFTRKLASQGGDSGWAEINTGDYHFGPESNGDFYLSSEYLDQTLQLPKLNKEANSFKVPAGTYLLTVAGTNVSQLKDMTLVATRIDGSSRAPRRAEGTETKNSYIAYPLRLVQTTSVGEGGVITGVTAIGGSRTVAGVDYYNLAGQRSTRPWQGVNIVVTRYTDGTSSTNKQIKN